jgi:hypothetical protein
MRRITVYCLFYPEGRLRRSCLRVYRRGYRRFFADFSYWHRYIGTCAKKLSLDEKRGQIKRRILPWCEVDQVFFIGR